ncbi:MAG: ParA family protein [Paracoccaceae bacterium]
MRQTAEPGPAPGQILAIANQKGGVGKTTTAINLGTALAHHGQKVLVVDLDPQGNASTGLGAAADTREGSTYDLLAGTAGLADIVVETPVDGLALAPATVDLSGSDVEMVDDPDRASRLFRALRGTGGAAPVAGYDTVLIDCPPSLNLLTVNAMTAADAILVPLQCEFFALEGLSQLLGTVKRVKNRLNPGLHLRGIVLTMFDRRNRLSAQVEQDVRTNLGDIVFETVIPRNVRLSEAPSHAVPVLLYDRDCAGSRAYLSLAEEMLGGPSATLAA